MKNKFRLILFSFFVSSLLFSFSLNADPRLEQILSNLTPQQKQTLRNTQSSQLNEFAADESKIDSIQSPKNKVSNQEQDEELKEEVTNNQKQINLNDLIFLEQLLVEDLAEFDEQLTNIEELVELSSSEEIELLEAVEETRKLLTIIKRKQREEISRRTQEDELVDESSLKPFGHEFLRFHPQDQQDDWFGHLPEDYKVGPGDILEILLYGQQNMAYSLLINRDGIIQFPEVGPINVLEQKRDFLSIKNSINSRIKQSLGDGVQSSITLGSLRSIPVSIVGQVESPGRIMIHPYSTITTALRVAGGVTEKGSLRDISVKRNGQKLLNFDLYEMLLNGNDSKDINLFAGDVIFVPAVGQQVTVQGQVNIPGLFELKGNTTLSSLISTAGGVSPDAFTGQISIQRRNIYGRYDLRTIDFDTKGDFAVLGGDLIEVPKLEKRFVDAVEVIGPIERSGYHQWHEKMKLSDLISDKGFLLENADVNFAYIIRSDSFRNLSILNFKPVDVLTTKFDAQLHPNDQILFLSNSNNVERFQELRRIIHKVKKQTPNGRKAQVVYISGDVHFPGEYLLANKMSIIDLVAAAGGLKDSAYDVDAELTRMSLDSNKFTRFEHIRLEPSSFMEVNSSQKVPLRPYDRLTIKPIPLWNAGQFVIIEGEVNFPGKFQISKGETLQQVLQRAGGLSQYAFTEGAIFTRKSLREKEEEEIERLKSQLQSDIAKSNLDALNPAEAARASSAANAMMERLEGVEALGRLVIDLNVIVGDSSDSKLLLKDGDKLLVPGYPASVSVMGEVNFPTSHMHKSDLTRDDYISLSGGFTENAAEDNVFVVKANGAVHSKSSNNWFKANSSSDINVGDTVIVPVDVDQSLLLEKVSYISQIIYQMSVTAAAVNSF